MTTTDTQPITRLVAPDAFYRAINQWGRLHGSAAAVIDLSTTDVRAGAAKIRDLPDPDLPDRPGRIADALIELADEADRRPVNDHDRANVTDADLALFHEWEQRCRDRSPMLAPLYHGGLDWLVDTDPRVAAARTVLVLLPDADLLLPGVDAALRPVLTKYAGEER